jgi:hypothetical protein
MYIYIVLSVAYFVYLVRLIVTNTLNLGEQIGSEPTLPYLSPVLNGQKLLVGANFASAGIGILNDTGVQFVSIVFYIPHYSHQQDGGS